MNVGGRGTVLLAALLMAMGSAGCTTTQSRPAVTYSDVAPHPLPPVLRERTFDGSLFTPGALGDLASDYVADAPGDPIVIRFDPKNGYPGISQGRTTRLMGQVVKVDHSGNLLVSAQRTIRDSSGVRKIVLLGRVAPQTIEPGNVVPVSLVSMQRFRSEGPSDQGKTPNFGEGRKGNPLAKQLKGLRKKTQGQTP